MATGPRVERQPDTLCRHAGNSSRSARMGRSSPSEPIAASIPARTLRLRVKGSAQRSRIATRSALDALIPGRPRGPPGEPPAYVLAARSKGDRLTVMRRHQRPRSAAEKAPRGGLWTPEVGERSDHRPGRPQAARPPEHERSRRLVAPVDEPPDPPRGRCSDHVRPAGQGVLSGEAPRAPLRRPGSGGNRRGRRPPGPPGLRSPEAAALGNLASSSSRWR